MWIFESKKLKHNKAFNPLHGKTKGLDETSNPFQSKKLASTKTVDRHHLGFR